MPKFCKECGKKLFGNKTKTGFCNEHFKRSNDTTPGKFTVEYLLGKDAKKILRKKDTYQNTILHNNSIYK